MKTIKFTQFYKVKDDIGTEYKEGQTEKMVDTSANHFIMRGVAVEVETDEPKKRGRLKKSDDSADVEGTDSGVSGNGTKSSKK